MQVNNGNGRFTETATYSGVAASDWSWGALIFDADNDGLNDIYVCNGIYHDVTDQNFIDFFANDLIQKMVLTGKKEQVVSPTEYLSLLECATDKQFKDLLIVTWETGCRPQERVRGAGEPWPRRGPGLDSGLEGVATAP